MPLAIDWLALAVFQLPSSMTFNSRDYLSVTLDASPIQIPASSGYYIYPQTYVPRAITTPTLL